MEEILALVMFGCTLALLMFGFPVVSDGQNWDIVQDLEHNEFAQGKIKTTLDELLSEKEAVKEIL